MSIKVAVRVRPYNDREKQGNSTCCVKMVSWFFIYNIYREVQQQQLWTLREKLSHIHLTIVFGHMMDLNRIAMESLEL
jgi:hypothetical protein